MLFEPIDVKSMTVRNRLWVAPMCQYSCMDEDGLPNDWHLVHLGSFARGGAGLVVTEATAVVPEGRISPRDTGIWNDEQVAAWLPITTFVKSQGARVAMQLAHAGRKASDSPPWGYDGTGTVPLDRGGWISVAPSAIAFPGASTPHELETDEVAALPDAFAAGARRAVAAGFDAVEIHGAHGYLIHEFLSPLSNNREDAYGGSAENRARLLVEVVRAVRAEVGDAFPIMVRLSASDWLDGGVTQESTAEVVDWVRAAGADFFDISSGGLLPAHVPAAPGYQVPFARFVKEQTGALVGTVGLITDAHQAEAILANGDADVVLAARQFLRDPHFALNAAVALGEHLDYWPAQHRRARPDVAR
jgi:2,4-dienoyl-CoA reductase-like NADH-dependent reductase (Old Yellow Enzyme family)